MRFAAIATSVAVLLLALAPAGFCRSIENPSHTSLEATNSSLSGKVTSPNPRCRTHRTLRLTVRVLTAEEADLDFHDRVVHTGARSTWDLRVQLPAGPYTAEVSMEAKTIGRAGPASHSCLGDFHERGFNIGR
jgi:hypothetical protein